MVQFVKDWFIVTCQVYSLSLLSVLKLTKHIYTDFKNVSVD